VLVIWYLAVFYSPCSRNVNFERKFILWKGALWKKNTVLNIFFCYMVFTATSMAAVYNKNFTITCIILCVISLIMSKNVFPTSAYRCIEKGVSGSFRWGQCVN